VQLWRPPLWPLYQLSTILCRPQWTIAGVHGTTQGHCSTQRRLPAWEHKAGACAKPILCRAGAFMLAANGCVAIIGGDSQQIYRSERSDMHAGLLDDDAIVTDEQLDVEIANAVARSAQPAGVCAVIESALARARCACALAGKRDKSMA
jgi:hypothetical protein